MKKIFSIIAITAVIAVAMSACKNKGSATQSAAIKYEDTVGLAQFQEWKAMNERASYQAYMQQNAPVKQQARRTYRSHSGYMSSSTSNTARVSSKKRGWSNAAKYTAIGGGSGIILGALVNGRNRVAGGAVGGILLGGAGYLLGRAKDKREGRY